MSQITLRNIPQNLERQIRTLAEKNQTSLNRTIITLVEKALGTSGESKKKRDLSSEAGTWNDTDVREFEAHVKPFGKIDEEIWK